MVCAHNIRRHQPFFDVRISHSDVHIAGVIPIRVFLLWLIIRSRFVPLMNCTGRLSCAWSSLTDRVQIRTAIKHGRPGQSRQQRNKEMRVWGREGGEDLSATIAWIMCHVRSATWNRSSSQMVFCISASRCELGMSTL